jgi:sulfur carrier protein
VTLTVTVNGREREVPADTTVAGLLAQLGLGPDGVAVAVGGQVVPRSAHPERVLVAGDRVEVLRAVGGG